MNIHIVVECWGNGPGDHGYTVFQDRTKAEKRWEALIHEYLDGSGRDAEKEIARSRTQDYVFHHSGGFMGIVTETVES